MVIQPLIGNPYNGYINPYYWVDDHPRLYGNNGSLDPSTYNTSRKFNSEFTPEKRWLEDKPFLLGPGTFSGAFAVKLRGSISNIFLHLPPARMLARHHQDYIFRIGNPKLNFYLPLASILGGRSNTSCSITMLNTPNSPAFFFSK